MWDMHPGPVLTRQLWAACVSQVVGVAVLLLLGGVRNLNAPPMLVCSDTAGPFLGASMTPGLGRFSGRSIGCGSPFPSKTPRPGMMLSGSPDLRSWTLYNVFFVVLCASLSPCVYICVCRVVVRCGHTRVWWPRSADLICLRLLHAV